MFIIFVLFILAFLSFAKQNDELELIRNDLVEIKRMVVDCETANKTLDPYTYYNYCKHKKQGE